MLVDNVKIFAENASVGRLLTILTHVHLQQKALASFNLSVKNFSQILFKIRFTYIKLTLNFRKQCAANFILREFAAIQTSRDTYRERRKKQHFQLLLSHCYKDWRSLCYPLGETDKYKDRQSKDILNSILTEELPDSDSEVWRTMSSRGFVMK